MPTDAPRAVDAALMTLAIYGRHLSSCMPSRENNCTCGLNAAIRAARAEAANLTELVAAARAWRDVIGGKLTVPPQAYLDVECRLASAVDALGDGG